MYSSDYPVDGCFCCDKFEAVDDSTAKTARKYDIYQTCVDAAGAKEDCFNKVNRLKHNVYRKQHSLPAAAATEYELKFNAKLAKDAAAYAKELQKAGRLTPAPATALKWEVDAAGKAVAGGKLCGESLLELPAVTEADPNYTSSALVTDSFYKGGAAYDTSAHGIDSALAAAKVPAAMNYAQLLWRASTEVGFGIAGNFAVARYCVGGNTPAGDTAAYAINVCPKGGCAKCPKPIKGLAYQNCFNARALTAANIKRAAAGSGVLALDVSVAAKAQAWAEELSKRADIASSSQGDGKTPMTSRPANCGENLFEQKDAGRVEGLADSDDAVDAWFAGQADYDFAKGEPASASDAAKKARSDAYTRMVWKGSTKVGFGIHGRFVVAWFCETEGNKPVTVAAFKENVPKACLAAGHNTCFDEANRKVLDERRGWHEATKTEKNDDAAKALQLLMNGVDGDE
jgi:uncharacterized protein YkwD